MNIWLGYKYQVTNMCDCFLANTINNRYSAYLTDISPVILGTCILRYKTKEKFMLSNLLYEPFQKNNELEPMTSSKCY